MKIKPPADVTDFERSENKDVSLQPSHPAKTVNWPASVKTPRPVALPKWQTSCLPSCRPLHNSKSGRIVFCSESEATATIVFCAKAKRQLQLRQGEIGLVAY